MAEKNWDSVLFMSVEERQALGARELRERYPNEKFEDSEVKVNMGFVNGVSFHVWVPREVGPSLTCVVRRSSIRLA